MPPVLIPVAIAAATGGAALALGVASFATVAISVAATAASAGLSYFTAERPVAASSTAAASGPVAAPANAQRDITTAQARPERRFILGRVRTGGTLFFHDNANPWLYVGTLLGDGPIDGVEAVYFGQTLVEIGPDGFARPGLYYNLVFVNYGLGATDQATDALLGAAWPGIATPTFRQRGVARAVARLTWGTDAANHSALWSGSTTPTYIVRGVKAFDPRDPTQLATNRATWKYTANGALLTAFVLVSLWGSALDVSDIDWASVAAAADVCDSVVTYNGASVPRYVTGGIFQAGADIGSQINSLLQSFDGSIGFDNGLYRIDADEARTPALTITDDDVIEIGEFEHAVGTDSLFGVISATYFDIDDEGRQKTSAAYAADAAGRETVIGLPFVAAEHSAQILAYKALARSREGRAVSLTVTDVAVGIVPFSDTVQIASVAAPWLNGHYEVSQADLTGQGVTLKLRGYATDKDAAPTTYLV